MYMYIAAAQICYLVHHSINAVVPFLIKIMVLVTVPCELLN